MADQQQERLVPIDQRIGLIKQLFAQNNKALINSAPRSGGDPARLIRIAFNSIALNPDLADCTHVSILGGVYEALKLGVTLGGPMQEAWLVPFRNTKKGGIREATFIVGYMGYRNIIDRGRAVLDMHPRAVHHRDEFEYWFGDQPRIIHKPKGAAPLVEKDLKAVYCVANLRGGGRQSEVLEMEEILAHKARSRAKDTGPWANPQDFVPMALKTSVRKLAKYVPKSSELLARALDLDEKADMGLDQDFELPAGAVVFDQDPQKANESPSLRSLTEKLPDIPLARPTPAAAPVPVRGDLNADDIFRD